MTRFHKTLSAIALSALLAMPVVAIARGGGGHGGHSASHSLSHGGGHHSSSYCATCVRDSHGRIARSSEAKDQFMRETGYPHGRQGYVVDHIVPLKRGGADAPWNLQWQTKADAKSKDKWE